MGSAIGSKQQSSCGPKRRVFLGESEEEFLQSLRHEELTQKRVLIYYFRLLHEGQLKASPQLFDAARLVGVPYRFRWQVWRAISGWTGQPGLLKMIVARGWDPQTADLIQRDLNRTFPTVREFDGNKKFHLANILGAFACLFPNVGYVQGMNFIAGFLLLVANGSAEDAFLMFSQVMVPYGGSLLFAEGLPLLRLYSFQYNLLFERLFPDLRHHLAQHSVTGEVYFVRWALTMLTQPLSFGSAARVWDMIICDGLQTLVFLALATMQLLRPRLLKLGGDGILSVLSTRGDGVKLSGDEIVHTALQLKLPCAAALGAESLHDELCDIWACEHPEEAAELSQLVACRGTIADAVSTFFTLTSKAELSPLSQESHLDVRRETTHILGDPCISKLTSEDTKSTCEDLGLVLPPFELPGWTVSDSEAD